MQESMKNDLDKSMGAKRDSSEEEFMLQLKGQSHSP